jgi:hypothetical protein
MKPGDKVRLTKPTGGFRAGTIGTLHRVLPDCLYVDMRGKRQERDAIVVELDGVEAAPEPKGAT